MLTVQEGLDELIVELTLPPPVPLVTDAPSQRIVLSTYPARLRSVVTHMLRIQYSHLMAASDINATTCVCCLSSR